MFPTLQLVSTRIHDVFSRKFRTIAHPSSSPSASFTDGSGRLPLNQRNRLILHIITPLRVQIRQRPIPSRTMQGHMLFWKLNPNLKYTKSSDVRRIRK